MILEELNKNNTNEWLSFLKLNNDTTVYHTLNWKNVIENTYNFKSKYILIRDKDELIGILPFTKFYGFKLKKTYLSLPYSPFAGLVSIKKLKIEEILNKLNFKKDKIIIRQKLNETNVNSDIFTFILRLNMPEEEMWKKLKDKVRNQIRKSHKFGFKIEKGYHLIEDLLNIYSINMKRLGTPVHSRVFYDNIIKYFDKSSDVLVVKKGEKVISAMLLLYYKDTVYNYIASSLFEYRSENPNMLLYWEAIKLSMNLGFHNFDFGRSYINSGTYDFKRQWGTDIIPLKYYQFVNGNYKELAFKNTSKLSSIWRHLPESYTNYLNPIIRKRIP